MDSTRQEAEALTGAPLCSQSRVARLERRGQAKVFTVLGLNWTCSHGFSPLGPEDRPLTKEVLQRSLALDPSMSWIQGLEATSGW